VLKEMIDFRTAIRSIKQGKIDPLYHLKGNDLFLQDLFINEVELALGKQGGYEKKVLSVADMGGQEILSWLTSVDMFTSVKLSIFRDPQLLKGNQRKEFLEYLSNPVRTHCLITVDPGDQRKTAMYRELEDHAATINVNTPRESELLKWVNYIANEHHLELTSEVKERLITLTGDSLAHMNNELEKLGLLLGEKGPVTLESLKDFSTWQRSFVQDDFLIAVGTRDSSRAIQTGLRLLSQADSILMLIFPLFQLYQELLYLKMRKAGTFKSYRGFIALSGTVRNRLPDFVKAYHQDELVLAIHQLHEIDRRTKQSQSSAPSELSHFVAHVVQRSE